MSPTTDDDSADIPTFEELADQVTGRGGEDGSETDVPVEKLEADIEERFQPGDADAAEESEWIWMGDVGTPEEGPGGADFERQEYDDVREVAQSSDGERSAKLEALEELADDVSNILLLGPSDSAVENDLCASLMNHDSGPRRRRVLVTTEQTPDERLATLRDYGGGSFEGTTVIAVGERVRTSSGNSNTFEIDGETVTIKSIRDHRDLTRLGLLINQSLSEDRNGAVPTICFQSLSTLIEGDNLEMLFRFLHVLENRLRHAGATAHYHLDPSTVAPEEVKMFQYGFDLTVVYDDEGNVSIHP